MHPTFLPHFKMWDPQGPLGSSPQNRGTDVIRRLGVTKTIGMCKKIHKRMWALRIHRPNMPTPMPSHPWVNPWGQGGALATHDLFLTFFSEVESYNPSLQAPCDSTPMERSHVLWGLDLGFLGKTPSKTQLLHLAMGYNAPNHACTSGMV